MLLIPVVTFSATPETEGLNTNSGFKFATIQAKGYQNLHAEGVIRGGKSWDLDLLKLPSTSPIKYQEDKSSRKLNSCFSKAPQAQPSQIRYANLRRPKPPLGFENGGITSWINAVNYSAEPGYVLLRALRIYGIDESGIKHLVNDDLFWANPNINPMEPAQGYALKLPTDVSGWGTIWRSWQPGDGTVFQMVDIKMEDGQERHVIKIPTSDKPDHIFHLWNPTWERPRVYPKWSYGVEAEVLPVGAGMIQIGFDYWTSPGSDGVNTNGEGAMSHWTCSKPNQNWITINIGVM